MMSNEIEIKTATGEAAVQTPAAPPADELAALKARAEENWDRYVRLAAEFDNFKKRAARQREEAIRFANQALLARLLPVLDNFEMAQTAAAGVAGDAAESLRTGVNMILNQLKATLAEAGIEEINALGQVFDPALHEAVSQQESRDVPEGHVLQQLRKGYKLRDRLLRPASVIVAKPPAARS
jgi:molecular chaperone GrpE